MHSVTTRVQGAAVDVRQSVEELISLERRVWSREASAERIRSTTATHAECAEYMKQQALKLDVAYSVCPDLRKADVRADIVWINGDDFGWGELLIFYHDIVSAIDIGILKGVATSNPLAWQKGETQHCHLLPIDLRQQNAEAVFPPANRCRAIMSENTVDQHAYQVCVEARDESFFAIGVFPEEVFQKWNTGEWCLSACLPRIVNGLKWDQVGMEKPTGIEIVNEGLATALQRTNMFTNEEFDLFKVINLSCDSYIMVENKYFKPASQIIESPITEVDGGVVIAVCTPVAVSDHPSAGVSQSVMTKIAAYLASNKIPVEEWFQHFDFDNDDKLSLSDLQSTAKKQNILGGLRRRADMQAIFFELKEEANDYVSPDAWMNAISAAMPGHGGSKDATQSRDICSVGHHAALLLAKDSTLGILLDCERNRISFSIDSKLVGESNLVAGNDSKFHAAVIYQSGKNSCRVHIASAPLLSFHASHCTHATKVDCDNEVEILKESLKGSDIKAHGVLFQLLNDDIKAAKGGKVLNENSGAAAGGTAQSLVAAEDKFQSVIEGQAAEVLVHTAQTSGLRGKFYCELVEKIGEERACIEFYAMLDTWKTAGYAETGLQGIKKKALERANMINNCKVSLQNVYTAYDDCTAKARRLLEHKQRKACFKHHDALLTFFRTSTKERCCRVKSLLALRIDPGKKGLDSKIIITPEIKAAFHEILRCEINITEGIAACMLDIVVDVVAAAAGGTAFGPIFDTMHSLVTGVSSSLYFLQKTAESLHALEFDCITLKSVDSMKSAGPNDVEHFNDLSGAHGHNSIFGADGDIRVKRVQALARATATQQCMARLEACDRNDAVKFDLVSSDLLLCHKNMSSELWLLECALYDATHADRVLAWVDRQNVASELMRMVKQVDDNFLQQPYCQRRFDAMLNTIEAACKVLPLTSKDDHLPTERHFRSVKKQLDRILSGAQIRVAEAVQTRFEKGKARIQKRWNIGEKEIQERKEKEDKMVAGAGEEMEVAEERYITDVKDNLEGPMGDADKSNRWELRRAEARYWQAMTLLYSQQSQDVQEQINCCKCKRRSVMRCLELLDDTRYAVVKPEGQKNEEKGAVAEETRQASGASTEMHLDDATDEWEARLLGMLSLQHESCKMNFECFVANTSTLSLSDDLPLRDLASGDRKELHLCEPDLKLAAFVASFIAHSSPSIVRIFICDKNGKPRSIYDNDGKALSIAPPIILVTGGGLAAHLSTNEDGDKLLDFSAKGLSLYGLRVLVEAARADEELVEATIAGVNDLDLSNLNSTFTREKDVVHRFKRKAVIQEMRFQSNDFGEDASVESVNIICNIINVSASNIRTLDLSSNTITAAGAGVLARFLSQGGATVLKHLNLSNNKLCDEGAQFVSEMLKSTHQDIHLLDLAKNNIQWEGALHVAEAISFAACHVTELSLAGNSVGSQGMVALSASLIFNRSMQSLDVSANQIGDIGVEALAYKWPAERGSLHSLISLNLSENDITELGAEKLFSSDFDKTAPKLVRLILRSNRIMHKGIDRIASLLPSCKILRSLCLETQQTLSEMSNLNTHQLFVRSGISSDEAYITEPEAKLLVLAGLRSCTILKLTTTICNSDLLKVVLQYCNSAQGAATQIESEKQIKDIQAKFLETTYLATRKKTVRDEWEGDTSKKARSEAMKRLKTEWARAGLPPSHLNRQDLSMQSKQALIGLVECKDSMRAKEADWYLSDSNYTTALTTSIDAKTKCVQDYRIGLFARLLRPLRWRLQDEGIAQGKDQGRVLALYTDVAVKILDRELKCSALNRVLEYQLLLLKQKKYQDAVEQARSSSCSASVTTSFVEDILTELPTYKSMWSSKFDGKHTRELAQRVLADVVQDTMHGLLSTLDIAAMTLLQQDDRKRKQEASEKEEKAGTGSAFADAVSKLENFAKLAPGDTQQQSLVLPLSMINDDERKLLDDLCHSHYTLICTEKKAIDSKVVSGAELASATTSNLEDVLIIDRGDTSKPAQKRPASEEEVMKLLKNPDFTVVWALSGTLSKLWNVASGDGTYAATYPQGSPSYWQEVGWLVSSVPLSALRGLAASIPKQEAMWALRWGGELYARDTVGRVVVQDGLARMKCYSFFGEPDKQAQLIKSNTVTFYEEHISTVNKAHSLCSSLGEMWDRDAPNPYGFIRDTVESKIGGSKGEFAKFLEVLRMLKHVKGVMDTAEEERVKKKKLEAIVQEIRDFCAQELPLLCPAYFNQKAGPLLRHPVRLAQQRITAVRQHVAGLFKTKLKQVETAAERFDSPALRGLLADTAQHVEHLSFLQSSREKMAFDTHLSECLEMLSLPVAVAANAPVTCMLGLMWEDAGSEKPQGNVISNPELAEALSKTVQFAQQQWDKFEVSNLSYNSYIKVGDKFFKPAVSNRMVTCVQLSHLNPTETKRCYSSVKHNDVSGEGHARSCLDSAQAWSPAISTDGAWMEIDLGDIKLVSGVVTQGCATEHRVLGHQYVRTIKVAHRGHIDEEWVFANSADSRCFTCKSGDEKVEHVFDVSAKARYIRIHIQNWHCGIALRVGVLEKPSEVIKGTIVLYRGDQCLVAFEEETKWCKTDELVDERAAELDTKLQTRVTSELAQLKQLYHEGGAPAKSKKVYAESIKRVRKTLDDELKAWDKAVEELKGKPKTEAATNSVKKLFRKHQDWLKMVFGSIGGEYMKNFWNLNTEQPSGNVCLVESHQWKILQRFVAGAGEAIDMRVKGNTEGKTRSIRWDFVNDTSQQGQDVHRIVWEEGQDGVSFLDLVATGTGNTNFQQKALGTPLDKGSLVFTLESFANLWFVGIALGGFQMTDDYTSKHAITLLAQSNGTPVIYGQLQEELTGYSTGKPAIKAGEHVRVDYNGSLVEFFVNDEPEPRFKVEDVTGPVRPLAIFYSQATVALEALSEQTASKRLILSCSNSTSKHTTEEGMNTEEAAACCKDSACQLCREERETRLPLLLNDLLVDLGQTLRECAHEVAATHHHHQAWEVFRKSSATLLPAASEEKDVDGRVEAAMNRLPAALLAEPQCCHRMLAAVACLAAASKVLPMAKHHAALALDTRFLVPPFEELAETPHLLRCVELLELGTASNFKEFRLHKPLVWEKGQDDSVVLSENGAVAAGRDRKNALGTPFDKGSLVFTLESFADNWFVGIALGGFQMTDDHSSKQAITLLSQSNGTPVIYGQFQNELAGDVTGKPAIKVGEQVRVDFDGSLVRFFVNDEPEPRFKVEDVTGPVRPLAIFHERGTIRMTNLSAKEASSADIAQQDMRLSLHRATESLSNVSTRDMSTWEARMFGSLCVSPYALSTTSGTFALQQLAAGDLARVTLTVTESICRDAAFLAHFVARCCKNQVGAVVQCVQGSVLS